MRLFDKVLTQANTRADVFKWVRLLPRATVLCCDEIARYYAESKTELWESDRYPYSRPPWDTFFCEWNVPRFVSTSDGELIPNHRPFQQEGMLGIVTTEQSAIKEAIDSVTHNNSEAGEKVAGSDMAVKTFPVFCKNGKVFTLELNMVWFMRKDGWVNAHVLTGPALDTISADDALEFNRAIGMMDHIAFLAFTFANCSNVKLEDVTEQVQPSAKIMRRLKLPCVKRYTLNIAGHIAPVRRDNDGPHQEGVMPFHLCRGHFATYTAERPLFGKHVGRFWIPPHTRGREERGKIEKDYAIATACPTDA